MLAGIHEPRDVGRTWPDFLHEHATAGVVLTLALAAVTMFLFGMAFIAVAYRRAVREGRSFDAWGGYLFKLGAPSASAATASSSSHPPASAPRSSGAIVAAAAAADPVDPPNVVVRGALALVRAAHSIATAPTDAEANEREGYLLSALYTATTHLEGTTRRASILKVSALSGGDEAMTVHHGFPETTFVKPHTVFRRSAFEADGAGLCWAAVHACRGPHGGESIKRQVFHAPDVAKEASYLHVPGHHSFKSILIAPIHVDGHLLGVVCLDSAQTDHYEEDDQYLIAIAALALATAWHKAAAAPKAAAGAGTPAASPTGPAAPGNAPKNP
jgi:hypothetical protein